MRSLESSEAVSQSGSQAVSQPEVSHTSSAHRSFPLRGARVSHCVCVWKSDVRDFIEQRAPEARLGSLESKRLRMLSEEIVSRILWNK
jgi:hypothetical protein